MFDNFFNLIFGPIMNLPDPINLLIISFILTGLITLAYKYLTDQEKMKGLKGEMKLAQKNMKEFKDQPDKMMAMQKDVMKKNMEYMKHSMKPTLFTFVPIIIIFGWLRNYYEALGNPDVFLGLTWIWAYIIFSLVISIVLRKVMKIS